MSVCIPFQLLAQACQLADQREHNSRPSSAALVSEQHSWLNTLQSLVAFLLQPVTALLATSVTFHDDNTKRRALQLVWWAYGWSFPEQQFPNLVGTMLLLSVIHTSVQLFCCCYQHFSTVLLLCQFLFLLSSYFFNISSLFLCQSRCSCFVTSLWCFWMLLWFIFWSSFTVFVL